MKQLINIIVLLAFIEPGFAAVDDSLSKVQTGEKVLIFAMPGKKPMTINPETGEIKIITPKDRPKNDNNE